MVQLDWNIENDTIKQKRHSEDPEAKRQRAKNLRRLLLLILLLGLIVAAAGWAAMQRLQQVDQRLEALLVDTVSAEVAALRIGDFQAFADLQRSATDDWISAQTQLFQDYQTLKSTAVVELSGRVSDVVINGQRGRVQVQEVIDGVPYTRTWFYWRYEDGWRHVPPDYTFWGTNATLDDEQWTINFQELDRLTAEGVATHLSQWLETGCNLLDCAALPPIIVEIVSEPLPAIIWDDSALEEWRLLIPSPYLERARTDLPFNTARRIQAANLLAERMVDMALGDRVPDPAFDAAFLRESAITWLYGELVEVETGAQLLESVVDAYGPDSVRQLLAGLQPVSDISVLASVLNTPDLSSASLVWSDFVLWRLELEDQLIVEGNESQWLMLYDQRDPTVISQAYTRYNTPGAGDPDSTERTLLNLEQGASGDVPQLEAQLQVQNGTVVSGRVVLFNLVNNNWLRAN